MAQDDALGPVLLSVKHEMLAGQDYVRLILRLQTGTLHEVVPATCLSDQASPHRMAKVWTIYLLHDIYPPAPFFSTQFLFFITLHNPHFRVKLCVHFLFFLPVIFMANWRLYSSLIGDCYHLDSLSVWTCEGVGDLFACFISLGFHGTSVRARWFSLYTHPVSSVVEFLAH